MTPILVIRMVAIMLGIKYSIAYSSFKKAQITDELRRLSGL